MGVYVKGSCYSVGTGKNAEQAAGPYQVLGVNLFAWIYLESDLNKIGLKINLHTRQQLALALD